MHVEQPTCGAKSSTGIVQREKEETNDVLEDSFFLVLNLFLPSWLLLLMIFPAVSAYPER